jgi:hypothetical protein
LRPSVSAASEVATRVTHAKPMDGYGIMVEIDHGNGLVTRYARMSKVVVEEGQEVAQCEVLGARAAARPGRICTTKFASTASRLSPNATCAWAQRNSAGAIPLSQAGQ